MILADLTTHLLTFVDLTTKIGDRVYSNRAPRGTASPYILLGLVGGNPYYTLSGEAEVAQPTIEVACWATDPGGAYAANEVADLVRSKISGWRGEWGDTFVCDCSLESEPFDLVDEPPDGSDNWIHGVTQTYRVTHRRAAPTLS